MPLSLHRIALLALLAAGSGCQSRCGWTGGGPASGHHPDPEGAIRRCEQVLKDAKRLPPDERARRVMQVCSRLFTRPKCAAAWRAWGRPDIENAPLTTRACACAYCPVLGIKHFAFCRTRCPGGAPVPNTTPAERAEHLSDQIPVWTALLRYEFGSDPGRLKRVRDLLLKVIESRALLVKTPRLSRVKRQPPRKALGLKLYLSEAGILLTSIHGRECPAGVAATAPVCFPSDGGRITDRLLKRLQAHLWWLHAKKYRAAKHYADPDDRHLLVLVPAPTVRYEDIVRLMDVAREIPRDATNPPPPRGLPADGCAAKPHPKTGAPTRVRAEHCMYHRVTLSLGSDEPRPGPGAGK